MKEMNTLAGWESGARHQDLLGGLSSGPPHIIKRFCSDSIRSGS